GILQTKNPGPLFLQILEADVEKARHPEYQEDGPLEAAQEEDSEGYVSNTGHMPTLLDTQKRMLLFERNLAYEKAEKMGWIIELPIEELTIQEFAQLDLSAYLNYLRINCDSFSDFEDDAEEQTAKASQEKFLNEAYEALFQERLNLNLS
ncbi:MAG: hypothetical protein ACP5I1_01750, partial [Candidatus Hinthialibacter sp.]